VPESPGEQRQSPACGKKRWSDEERILFFDCLFKYQVVIEREDEGEEREETRGENREGEREELSFVKFPSFTHSCFVRKRKRTRKYVGTRLLVFYKRQ